MKAIAKRFKSLPEATGKYFTLVQRNDPDRIGADVRIRPELSGYDQITG